MSKFSEEESVQKEPEQKKGGGCLEAIRFVCLIAIAFPVSILVGTAIFSPSQPKPLPSASLKSTITNSPSDSPSTPQNGCENAMMAAASVPSSQDTLEDTDQAFVACNSVQEFVDASKKYPDALDRANEQIYIDNRCQVPYLKKTPLCKSRQ
jgi:hypothetical protein